MNRLRTFFTPERIRYYSPVIVTLVAIIVLIFIPTGFENKLIYQGTERVPAKVLAVDNSMIIDTGLVRSGDQNCDIEFLDGQFRGQEYTAVSRTDISVTSLRVSGGSVRRTGIHRREHAHRLAGDRQDIPARRHGVCPYQPPGRRDTFGFHDRPLPASLGDSAGGDIHCGADILRRADGTACGAVVYTDDTAYLEGSRAAVPEQHFPDTFRHCDNFGSVRAHSFAGVRI